MHNNCKKIREIVTLWHETERGHYLKCREKQVEFSEMMWGLYEELNKKEIKWEEQ